MSHLSGVKGNANDVDECSLVAQTSTLHCAPQDVLHAQNVNDHPEMKVPNVSQVMEKINQKTVLVQKKSYLNQSLKPSTYTPSDIQILHST